MISVTRRRLGAKHGLAEPKHQQRRPFAECGEDGKQVDLYDIVKILSVVI